MFDPRSYLELVLAGLSLRRRVEEVDRENLSIRKCQQDMYIHTKREIYIYNFLS